MPYFHLFPILPLLRIAPNGRRWGWGGGVIGSEMKYPVIEEMLVELPQPLLGQSPPVFKKSQPSVEIVTVGMSSGQCRVGPFREGSWGWQAEASFLGNQLLKP